MCVINPHIASKISVCYIQCWRKLFLKVMHYNIVLLPKKVSNYISYFFCKVMRYVLLRYNKVKWIGLRLMEM